jgi:biopolymer transport protein ExbD
MINLILILLLAFISASAMARVQDSDHTPAASSRETKTAMLRAGHQ